jgi:hypothetical protein
MLWQAIVDPQRLTPCGRSVMPSSASLFAEWGNTKPFRVRWHR